MSGPQFVSVCIAADAGRVLARWISTATVFQWAAGQPFQQLWTGEIPRGSHLEMDESGTLLMTDSPDALEGLPPGIEQVHIPESGRYGDSICLRVPFQPGRIVLVQENESGGVLGGRSEMTVSEFHLAEKWKVRESSSFSLKGEGESRVGCVHQGETTILLARKGDATFLIRRGKGNADRMIPCPELTRGVRCLGISGDERHCVVVGDGGLDMCGAVELWALPRMERLARRTIDSDDRLESVGRHGLAIDAGRIVSDFQSLLFVYDLPALLNAQTPGLHPSPDFVEPDAGCFLTLLPDASQQAPAVVVPELRQVHPLQLEERGRTLLLMNRWRARLAYHPASACLAVIQGADRSDVHDSVPGSGGLEGDSGEEPDEEVSRVLIYQFPEMVVLGGSILTGHCRSLRHHPTEARFLVTVVRTSPDTTMKWLEISLDHQGRELGMRPILSVEDSESLWWVDSRFDFDLLIRTREGASWDQVGQEFLARFRDGSEWTVARWVCPPHSESQPTLAEDGRVLFAESTGHLLEVDVPGRAILSQELVVGASYRTGRLHPTRHQAALLRVEGILELRDLEEQKTLALFTAGEEIVEVGDFRRMVA